MEVEEEVKEEEVEELEGKEEEELEEEEEEEEEVKEEVEEEVNSLQKAWFVLGIVMVPKLDLTLQCSKVNGFLLGTGLYPIDNTISRLVKD